MSTEHINEDQDRIVSNIDKDPDLEARIGRALEVRKQMGIYGEGGQMEHGFYDPIQAQGILEYCFGLAWGGPLLDLKTREIIVITALVCQQLDGEVEWHVRSALNLGLTREEIIAVLTHLTVYCGFPKANHGIRAAKRAFDIIDKENGIEPPAPYTGAKKEAAEAAGDRLMAHADPHPDAKERIQNALSTRQKMGIYGKGGQADDGLYKIAPHYTQALLEYAWGMIWSNPVLDMKTREIICLAAFAAQQLVDEAEWHVRSSLNHGLTREEINEVFIQCSPYIGFPKTNDMLRAAMRAFDRLDKADAQKD